MPKKHKINFHKEKIMEREREIFKTSLMKGTKITACTLLLYWLLFWLPSESKVYFLL